MCVEGGISTSSSRVEVSVSSSILDSVVLHFDPRGSASLIFGLLSLIFMANLVAGCLLKSAVSYKHGQALRTPVDLE